MTPLLVPKSQSLHHPGTNAGQPVNMKPCSARPRHPPEAGEGYDSQFSDPMTVDPADPRPARLRTALGIKKGLLTGGEHARYQIRHWFPVGPGS